MSAGAHTPASEEGLDSVLGRRLVVVTGKGGVGKTTVALALGLRAARSGRRTIVCELGNQARAFRAFGQRVERFRETPLAERLFGLSIDPDEAMREYVLLQIKVRAARDLLFRSRIFTYLAAATPGLRELVTMGKVWELAQPRRRVKGAEPYDLVVVDAPATGHGVGFLQTPRTYRDIARVGPIAQQGDEMNRFLTSAQTAAVLVCLPEEMPVNETGMLERELKGQVGIAVDRVYMNGMYPQRFSEAEADQLAERLSGAGDGDRAALRAALFEHRRRSTQAEQLERLDERIRAPLHTLPFLYEPELGAAELAQLAEALG